MCYKNLFKLLKQKYNRTRPFTYKFLKYELQNDLYRRAYKRTYS